MTARPGRSCCPLQKATSAAGTHISPCRNASHKCLAPGQWHTRLRYTMGSVVPNLASPLLSHSLFTLPLEAKLTLVTISPTIVTMKPMSLGLGLGWGCSLGFSPLDFSTGFSSLGFSTYFPKNTFPKVLSNLMGF
jgi:hypothetical protein